MHDYWQRQLPDKPLYPDLLWSRPETQRQAGKLLVIGGSAHGFAAPADCFSAAVAAGIGTVRVALPDALRRTVGAAFSAGEYAPSTPSGSFAQSALAELTDMARWSDAVLLAGDFGRNSETAILLEAFAGQYHGQLTITGDALDGFARPLAIVDRADTLLVPSFAQLQKLAIAGHSPLPFTHDLDVLHLVEAAHRLAGLHAADWLFERDRLVMTAAQSRVVTSSFSVYDLPSLSQLAAAAAVWRLQNPARLLAATATSFARE